MNNFQISNKLVAFSAWPVAIAGILSLGYAVLRVIIAVLDDGSKLNIQPSNSFNSLPQSSNYDISALDRITPFVSRNAKPVAPVELVPDAPETSLDIVLYGVIFSENGAGSVILSVFGQPQVLYKIGDTIEDTQGAVIHSITADSAVIERQGEFERISFNHAHNDGIVTISPETYVPDSAPNYVITTELASSPDSERKNIPDSPNPGRSDNSNSQPSPAISQTSTRLSRLQIFELASSVRLERETGSVGRGLAVYPTRNVRLFDASGLQAGDIILQIDGVVISPESNIVNLISQFENKTSVTLLIARGNSRVQHTVTLSD